jgi:hypothetical protein
MVFEYIHDGMSIKNKKTRFQSEMNGLKKIPGGVLLFHPRPSGTAHAVPSAQKGLTDLFERGKGSAVSIFPT